MKPQISKQNSNSETACSRCSLRTSKPCLAEHLLRQVDSAAHTRLGGAGAPPSGKLRCSLRTSHSKLRTAFTLIELLVVIAIISLLVSILLPSLQQAKKLARRVQCMTQLRNLGTAIALYGEDNDQLFPDMPKPWHWEPTAYTQAFTYALAPYLNVTREELDFMGREGKEPFLCPEDNQLTPEYTFWGRKSSYMWNPHCGQPANAYGTGNPQSLYITDSQKPGETTLLRCGISNWHDPDWFWLWLDFSVDTSEYHGLWLWDGKSF